MHYNRARFNFLWGGTVASLGVAASFSPLALAQVVPDNTLGTEGSRVAPNVLIRGALGDRIDGGALRGSNLFHSFSQFNVNDGQRVYFSNPTGVENILSRVTGGDVSDIMGTLGVDGAANLYLLNPNGIIFGPNAQLDIAGSFVASTGSAFIFPNGDIFSAVDPQAPPLLTINVPVGIQYGQGNITNRGNLTTGQDLTLSGNLLDLQGQLQAGRDLTLQAATTVQGRDTATHPFITASGRDTTIQGNQGIDLLALSHPQSLISSNGNLSLLSDGIISTDAHFASGGNFTIRSLSGGLANVVSLYDPIISSTGNVDIAGSYSGASLLIESQGNIRIQGGVTITTPDTVSSFVGTDTVLSTLPGLIIRSGQASLVYGGIDQTTPPTYTTGDIPTGITLDGAVRVIPSQQGSIVNLTASEGDITTASIDASNLTGGNGGSITLTAIENITTSYLLSFSRSDSGDAGDGGAITLSAGENIRLDDLFSFSDSPSGNSGNGGSITLSAGENIRLNNDLFSYSFSDSGGAGDGGVITLSAGANITTDVLRFLRSYSDSPSGNSGNGGSITLSAGENITTGYLFSYSSSGSGDAGDGGSIALSAGENITTTYLSSSSSSSSGDAGDGGSIALSAGENITNGYSFSSSSSIFGSAGDGGGITLSAGTSITTSSLRSLSYSPSGNAGDGGSITLSADENIRTYSLDSYSYSDSGNAGNGGRIDLRAVNGDVSGLGVLGLADNERSYISSFAVSAENETAGQGGDVIVTAHSLISDLEIFTLSSSSGSGTVQLSGSDALTVSNVRAITSRQLEIRNPTFAETITINIRGVGQSGDILVQSPSRLTLENSSLQSDTNGGEPGGNVTLSSPDRITFDNSQVISSTNSTGRAGNITVETNQLSLNNSELIADTQSGGGGNIRLRGLRLLLMQNSVISTSAMGAANGGNISINTPDTRGGFIFGFNNSDIIAVAINGAGGQINIYPDGIFGFVEQAEPNLEILRDNSTNDISASSASGSQGIVNISILVDPIQGTIELPTNLVDASQQIAAGCGLGNNSDENEFIVTGRGGLPPSSSDPLAASAVDVPWVVADDIAPNNTAPNNVAPNNVASDNAVGLSATATDAPLVEAQGMWVDDDGNIHLVAEVETDLTANPTAIASQFCAVSSH